MSTKNPPIIKRKNKVSKGGKVSFGPSMPTLYASILNLSAWKFLIALFGLKVHDLVPSRALG